MLSDGLTAASGSAVVRSRRLSAGAGWARALVARVSVSVWVILAVTILLRVGLVAATWNTPTTLDPADFSRNGLSIAQGHGYPSSNRAPGGGPSAFRPPGYPVFLGAVYFAAGEETPPIARTVQSILLAPLTVLLIGAIATRIWGRRVGMIAMGVAAVAPPMVILSTALISEALFVPLMLACVAAALQARGSPHPMRWVVASGVLLGLAELTRTNAFILLPVVGFAVWKLGGRLALRGLVRPAALVLAAVLTVAPWTLRNWFVLHAFVPVSTEIGYTISGTYDQVSRADKQQPAIWVEAEHGASPEYGQILFNAEIHRWGEVRYGNALQAQAIKEIEADPAYLAKVAAWNTMRIFHIGELNLAVQNLDNTGIPRLAGWFEIFGFYPLALLALAGIAAGRVRRAPLWLWFVPLLLMTTVFVTGFIRFRSGIDPFLAILAALGIASVLDRRTGGRWPWGARRRRAGGVPAPEDQPASATTIRTMTMMATTAAPIITGR